MSEAAFVARVSVWRTLGLVVLGLGFVAMGWWMATGAMFDAGAALVGWICMLFFGGCTVAAFAQLFRRGTIMRIDAHGVFWRIWSDTTVPWSAIERAEVMRIDRQRFVSLWLQDGWTARSVSRRIGDAISQGMGFGDLTLNSAGLDRDFGALHAAIVRFGPSDLFDRAPTDVADGVGPGFPSPR